ncbi:SSI family serine proteinase inhibitor [Actinomadura macrotermitis]|uniref:Subtilase-type protease inhibitor n=1 Tax=Actinomadura macrotermitis TaxID=2585200 RepID=A0A7K0BVL9_9ACTN|nr:SSI family serine proteinase inhibitor [Actinomadura macrotermitis]MQY05218.1 subtilase-type protease inhibitor [Actinomadura macrotermitis]
MRYRTLFLATPGLALILASAACGSERASTTPDQKGSGSAAVQPTQAADRLIVQVKASPQAPAQKWTLTCDPAGGDHPKKDAACAALAKSADPFKAPPKDRICTKIYGGPETATVTGTWKGRPVDASFGRADGCQLHRWTGLAPLFGDVPKVR